MERVREEDVTAYYDKEIKNGPVEEEVARAIFAG